MPETIKLADGTEREVLTDDEKKDMEFRSVERKKQREELKAEKEELQEKLLKLTDKDFNFAELKKKTKEKEKEIQKKEEEIEESKKVFVERQTNEYQNDALTALVGEDKKEREKVLHYYNNELTTKAVTKNEIMEKMEKAYKLAVPPSQHSPINRAVGYTGRSSASSEEVESGASVEIRQKVFKTSDEEAKKYGKGWQPKF